MGILYTGKTFGFPGRNRALQCDTCWWRFRGGILINKKIRHTHTCARAHAHAHTHKGMWSTWPSLIRWLGLGLFSHFTLKMETALVNSLPQHSIISQEWKQN